MAMTRNLNRNVVPIDLQVRIEAMYIRNRNHFRYMGDDELAFNLGTVSNVKLIYDRFRESRNGEPAWTELDGLHAKLMREARDREQTSRARAKHDVEFHAWKDIELATTFR